MLAKPIEQIGIGDLQMLINDEWQEGKLIEYKRELYRLDANDQPYRVKQHEELLKDVSSFANTLGGHLIIGIEESGGVPTSIVGIDAPDPDALKLRLTQLIEQALEPRISFAIHAVKHEANRYVFVVRVLRSLIAPHRVVYQGRPGQFWARNSGGAYQMDTSDLRQSFTLSETLFDRIKRFRMDRTRAIMGGETPVPMPTGAKLIIHLIPTESFSTRTSFTPSALKHVTTAVRPLGTTSPFVTYSKRFNMDGFLRFGGTDPHRESFGYVQFYRNGIIETVADGITTTLTQGEAGPRYFLTCYERDLLQEMPTHLKCLATLGVAAPVWLFVTLAGVKGVGIHRKHDFDHMPPIDRDILYLPEAEIMDLSANPHEVLKPLFDMIWNAAGYPESLSFDSEGNWSEG